MKINIKKERVGWFTVSSGITANIVESLEGRERLVVAGADARWFSDITQIEPGQVQVGLGELKEITVECDINSTPTCYDVPVGTIKLREGDNTEILVIP